jgi:hypothetical protein
VLGAPVDVAGGGVDLAIEVGEQGEQRVESPARGLPELELREEWQAALPNRSECSCRIPGGPLPTAEVK